MMTAQPETVTVAKKSTSTTTPKKAAKTPTNKTLSNSTHSEKQLVRTPSSSAVGTAIAVKPAEKKLSDNPMSTPVKSTEAVSAKPPPVTLGKIPKLNPANKQKPTEKPAPSASLTDFKLDLLASDSSLPGSASKDMSLSEKAPPHRQLLPLKHRPLSPMDLDDNADSILGKPPFLPSNQRGPSKFSRANSIGPDHPQSQSPLSPVRSISNASISHLCSRSLNFRALCQHSIHHHRLHFHRDLFLHRQRHTSILEVNPHHVSSAQAHRSFSLRNIDASRPPPASLSRPPPSSSSSNSSRTHAPMSHEQHAKSQNLWDSASSDDEPQDDANIRR